MTTAHSETAQKLDALHFPLHGSRLIEASAGTGKTWTIAALYLRLVLGHGGADGFARPLAPPEILVMTFTRAATRELSNRIRMRLTEAARVLRGEAEPDAGDAYLAALRNDYSAGPAREQAAWRLAAAAEGMDDAAVQTIDAWCQRMLREHAFDSGALFDEALDADEATLRTQAARDYWRQQVYPLAPEMLERVLAVWAGVDALASDVRALEHLGLDDDAGEGGAADCLLRADACHARDVAALKAGWAERAEMLAAWVEGELADRKAQWDARKFASVPGWLRKIAAWSSAEGTDTLELTPTATERLRPEALLALRKPDAPPRALPPEITASFAAIPELLRAQQALRTPAMALRAHAAARIAERLAHLKQQAGSFGFHDMLVRLDRALAGPRGDALRARILAQHPVALIDEFQDTSPLQYRIFERLYQPQGNDPATALLLIGDPKQSIYAFRGADIYSYLAARRATRGRHAMLDTNYRSTQPLVDVVNHWFSGAEARPGSGAFGFRTDAGGADSAAREADPLPFVQVQAKGRKEQLRTHQGPLAPMTLVHALEPAGAPVQRQRFAARCAEQIVRWLNDAEAGFTQAGAPFQRLRPADIAVLVRSGTEAQAMQRALRRRGLASVYLSDKDSVFQSGEARDLLWWLQAVAEPRDARRLRTALATATLDLPIAELERLAHDDMALEARSEQLRALHSLWQTQGVLPMLRQTLHQFGLPARWLRDAGGERRLTNFLHLAELLQTASSTLDGEQALLRWLAGQLEPGAVAADEQIVRLESDADLVQIVTIHKSKGLEYPVVCLPFACAVRQVKKQKHNPAIALSDSQGMRALHLAPTDADWEQAERERLREDLRLLYVALTRARHALWLGFAAVSVGKSSKTNTHLSAAGSLLAGDHALEPEAWLAVLQQLAAEQPDIHLEPVADGAVPCTAFVPRGGARPLRTSPDYTAQFDRQWSIASFSQLVRGLPAASAQQALLPTHRPMPADDEALVQSDAESDGPALTPLGSTPLESAALKSAPAGSAPPGSASLRSAPLSSPRGATADLFPEPPAVWHGFARGTLAGNFLHEQLEWLSGEGFALEPDGAVTARLRRRCERSAYGAAADDAVAWLTAIASAPLPPLGVPLQALTTRLPEMEFWLPAERLPAADIDALCRAHILPATPRPALPERALHGMLMGFADLVFEHGGRYWVLDYKSNWLGPDAQAYDLPALQNAVAQHRYDVQAALYLLALHRLLRARLDSAYDPAQHLGGALFFFLRGIDGPAGGVLHLQPPLALLGALDALLDARDPPATETSA